MSSYPPKPAITENVLPEALCDDLIKEFQHKAEVDRTNRHFWFPKIVQHSSYVLVNDIAGELRERVFRALRDKGMVFSSRASCMFYRWTAYSYIPSHEDQGSLRVVSIYLNKNYNVFDGGMFLYRDGERDEWVGIEPKFNRSVYFDQTNHPDGTSHMVTPVTCENERMSIQMFEAED
jgi:hypothetical protein